MPAHALSRDELIRVLTAYTGITTADGAAGGTTLVDRNLIGANDYITGKTILIMSGPARNEDQGAASFDPVTGTITFSAFSAQITAGTIYRVVNISSVENLIIEIAKGQGLIYNGIVTAVPGANQFTIPSLAGMGAGKFDGATNPYSAFVFRDAGGAGAAPQGEIQAITAYVSATGIFTAPGFGGGGVAVDDEILIVHPSIATIMVNLDAAVSTRSTPADIAAAHAITDALVATRAAPGDAMALTAAERLIVQALILSDATPFAGATIANIVGATGIFHEQADTAVNTTAPDAPAENDILNLAGANTRYIVRSLRLKCADPGVNNITVRLYELVNNVLTVVDTFTIDTTNFGTYHSLMDMFGLPHLAGDQIQVTVQASAGGPYAVTGQYSHGKTNV